MFPNESWLSGVRLCRQTSIWLLFVAAFTPQESVQHVHWPVHSFSCQTVSKRLFWERERECEWVFFALCINQFGTLMWTICMTKMFRTELYYHLNRSVIQICSARGTSYVFTSWWKQNEKTPSVADAPCLWIHFCCLVYHLGLQLVILIFLCYALFAIFL